MKCHYCKAEITTVRRFLVFEVGDEYSIDSDGNVNIDEGVTGAEPIFREFEEGEHGVWFECPECEAELKGWEDDGTKMYTCNHCMHEITADEAIHCCGSDCEVVACGDCAGLLFDDYQLCQDCSSDDEEDEDEDDEDE